MRNATAFAKGEAAATAGLLITRGLVRRGSIQAADTLLDWLEASARQDVRVSVARARLLEWRRRKRGQRDVREVQLEAPILDGTA